jgi:hypothetical protein
MASVGSTWLQLLQAVFNEFNRLDLATTAPVLTAPVATDPVWVYTQEAIEYWEPRVFLNNQAYNQWMSTIVSNNPGTGWVGNLYTPPSDFEDDMQILINISGQNQPMIKISEFQMNYFDMQGPPTQSPVIGPPAYYCIWAGSIRLFPWPDAVYPMTAVYNSLIPVPTMLTASNFWTVEAASMIRHSAVGLIKRFYTKAPDWQNDMSGAILEYNKLCGRVRQISGTGHARPNYL